MAGSRQKFTPATGDRSKMVELPSSADDLPEEIEVDLDNKDPNAFEVVGDDVDDRAAGNERSLDEQEEDLRAYPKSVQSRINRLSFERGNEQRAREAAERERDAATNAATQALARLAEMEKRAETGTSALAASMLSRNETALASAKRKFKDANDNGDSDAMAEAQVEMAQLAAEAMAIKARTPRQQTPEEKAAAAQQVQQPQQQVQQRQAPPIAPKIAAWIGDNRSWFSQPTHADKTQLAYAVNESLLKRGFSPDSDEFVRELDKGIKAVYPDHKSSRQEGNGGQKQRGSERPNGVADGGRETERQNDPKRVTLTRSELHLAKKLGVTPQAYAREKVKMAQENGA